MARRWPRGVYSRTLGDWFADDFAIWAFADISGIALPSVGLINNSTVGESYYIYAIDVTINVAVNIDLRLGLKQGGTLNVAGNSVFYMDRTREQVSGQAWSSVTLSKTFQNYPLMYFGVTQKRLESAIGEPLAIVGNGDMLVIISAFGTAAIRGFAYYLPVTEVGPRPGSARA